MTTSINTISEPWHLRYCTGDQLPAAVLAYEATLNPTTPPEDDMPGEAKFVRISDSGQVGDVAQFVLTGKIMTWITSAAEKQKLVFAEAAINDPATGTPFVIPRAELLTYILLGPQPVYTAGQVIHTTGGHFQAWVH